MGLLLLYDKTLPTADSARHLPAAGQPPFKEAKYNKNLAALVELVGNGKLDQYSIYGFAATLLFKQAVEERSPRAAPTGDPGGRVGPR